MGEEAIQDGRVAVPHVLLRKMLPQAQELGIEIPGMDRIVPKVDLALPVLELAYKLGAVLKHVGLYRKGTSRTLVAQMGDDGWLEMGPHRFCSWVEKHCFVYKTLRGQGGTSYEMASSMGKDLAAKILESDDFLCQLPVIERTVNVRLPVVRADGKVELLPAGYDAATRVWCDDKVEYRLDMPMQEAWAVLEEFCLEFPWADMQERTSVELRKNRSFLVHLAAMVGSYCHLMLEPGTIRPLILVTANDQGSGKSLLVTMQLAGPFGLVASTDLPMSSGKLHQEKFTALLETVAQSMKANLYLDDVPAAVFSNALNRFITAPAHTGRKYGGNSEMFEVPAVTQVFMTGNNVDITRDIHQRALVVELFLKVDAESVQHGTDMTAVWMAQPEQRKRLLAALWAMVRRWQDSDKPKSPTLKKRAPQWSELVGGILHAFQVEGDPFAQPDLPMSGDRATDEMRKLLMALADDAEESFFNRDPFEDEDKPWNYQIDSTKVVEKARELGVLMDLVGGPEDKERLKATELKKLGRRLEKWRGKEDLVTSRGTKFRFGHRRQKSGTVYPIEWVDGVPEKGAE
jgi:hypothetical protein